MPDSTPEFPLFAPRRASRGSLSTRTTRSTQEGERQQHESSRRAQRKRAPERASRLHPSPPSTKNKKARCQAATFRVNSNHSTTFVAEAVPSPLSLPEKERNEPIEDREENKKKAERHRPFLLFFVFKIQLFLPPVPPPKLTCAPPPLARALVRRLRASLLASRRSVDDSIGVCRAFFEERKKRKSEWKNEESFFSFFTLSPAWKKKQSKQKSGRDSPHSALPRLLCSEPLLLR